MAKNSYDAIVIGGGMAGLISGNYLAKSGKRVLLLEQNHQAGGCMSGFWRKGFYFDGGDQSFESSGIMFPILEQLGLYDKNDFIKTDYRVITPHMDFVIEDLDSAINIFKKAFPHEAIGIESMFKLMERYIGIIEKFVNMGNPYVENGFKRFIVIMKLIKFWIKYKSDIKDMMTKQYIDTVTKYLKDENLVSLFGNSGYKNMVLMMGAGFWYYWAKDYWYPRGGLQSFINRLADKFQSNGGEIKYKTLVEKIFVKNGLAQEIKTKNGEIFSAKKIIYTGDYKRLFASVFDGVALNDDTMRKIKNAVLTEPLFSAYLGVNISPAELKNILKTHHSFYFPTYKAKDYSNSNDPELHKDSWLEISSPSIDNPRLAPPGKSSIVLQTITSYKWMNFWGTGGDEKVRNQQYWDLKKMATNQMIETAEKIIPGLRQKIEYQEGGSPMSAIRFTRNSEGASAGWTMDPEKAYIGANKTLLKTPVKNLLAAGHYTMWPGGVPSAALSGKVAAERALK